MGNLKVDGTIILKIIFKEEVSIGDRVFIDAALFEDSIAPNEMEGRRWLSSGLLRSHRPDDGGNMHL
jgi:hypothetical protein